MVVVVVAAAGGGVPSLLLIKFTGIAGSLLNGLLLMLLALKCSTRSILAVSLGTSGYRLAEILSRCS